MSDHLLTFDTATFERDVLQSVRPVLVDFQAEWCPPCRALAPTIESLADEYAGTATVGQVDVDVNPALTAQYDVRSIPTVLVFAGGEVVERFVGIRSKPELAGALDDAIRRVAA